MSEEVYDRAIVDNMLPPPTKIYFLHPRRYTSFAHEDILKCQSKYYCVCTHSEHTQSLYPIPRNASMAMRPSAASFLRRRVMCTFRLRVQK